MLQVNNLHGRIHALELANASLSSHLQDARSHADDLLKAKQTFQEQLLHGQTELFHVQKSPA